MILLLASTNRGKLAELRAELADLPWPVEWRLLSDFPGIAPAEEDGRTFLANALRKARHAARASGLPAIADDSGLEVDALGGRPGVRSARYAGEGATDAENNALLLRELEGVPDERRSARYVAVLACALPDGRAIARSGSCVGRILREPRGSGGFGYDPLFFHEGLGRTFAEASPAEKARISHRGAAVRALREALPAFLAQAVVGGGTV